jgi:chloramphenicol O-acetyltransferase
MNPFSSFTAEAVLRFGEGVAIVAGVLTVAALIGQTKASRVVNRQQRTDLEKFKQTSQLAIAEANERAAKLENEAEQARLELEKIRLTRFDRFNRNEFRNRIRGKPKIRVELLFQR